MNTDHNINSANEWASVGRQRVLDASKEVTDGRFGYAHQLRLIADECFAKEMKLRELAAKETTP